MADDLGQAELELSTDQSKLDRGLNDARRKSKGFLDDVTKTYRSQVSNIWTGVGQGLGQRGFDVVQDAIRGIANAAFGAIKASSDLRESMSLTGQVFEGNTDQMAQWADGAAHAFGQSKREALNYAASFGTTFKNVGFSLDEVTSKSQELTHLAADLGSAFNRGSDEAAIALRSGLIGESEPLRAFGVFLSEAAVQSKAVSMGIANVGDKLTDNQKVWARYQIIIDQTKDSQGMFGRDTDSLADAQKTLTAVTENLGAKLGAKLVPLMVQGAKAATDMVEHFDDIAPILAGIGVVIIGSLVPALLRLGLAAITATGPFAPLLLVLAALTAAVAKGTPTIDEMRAKLLELDSDHGFGRNQGMIDILREKIDALDAQAAQTTADWRAAVTEWRGIFERTGIPEAADNVITDLQARLKSGEIVIKDGALVMASGIPDAVKSQGAIAVSTINTNIGEMAREIRKGREEIVDAITGVIADAYDPLILAADITATKVELAEQRKIAAAKSSSEAEKAEAERRILQLRKDLGTMLGEQTRFGTDAQRLARLTGAAQSKELVAGLNSGDQDRRLASKAAAGQIASEIIALQNKTHTYGVKTGNAYIDGLIAAFKDRVDSVKRAFQPIKGAFAASSPPGPESPLHDIDKWGRATGRAWIDPLIGAIVAARSSLRGAVGGVGGDLALQGRSSFGLGELAGRATRAMTAGIMPMTPATAGTGPSGERGGDTYIFNTKVDGLLKAQTPFEVGEQLRRVARRSRVTPGEKKK